MVNSASSSLLAYYSLLAPSTNYTVPNSKDASVTSNSNAYQLSPTVAALLNNFMPDTHSTDSITSLLSGKNTSGNILSSLLGKPQESIMSGVYANLLSLAYNGTAQKTISQNELQSQTNLQSIVDGYHTAYQAPSTTSLTT